MDYGNLDQALAKWQGGDPVWSIEMGGLGPGYEQCIQVGAFELAKRIKDAALPDEKAALGDALDKHLYAVIAEVAPVLDGLSGAQAGAIQNLAYHFVKDGYSETLHQVEQDRRIQCSRKFPALAA
jgi:hypothetical protein